MILVCFFRLFFKEVIFCEIFDIFCFLKLVLDECCFCVVNNVVFSFLILFLDLVSEVRKFEILVFDFDNVFFNLVIFNKVVFFLFWKKCIRF